MTIKPQHSNVQKTILIIDDEPDIRTLISCILEDEDYQTRTAGNAYEALESVDKDMPDLVILDIWLEGSHMDGVAILETIKSKRPLLPVIMISGHGTIDTAVSALKKGAYDFLEKPFKTDRLLVIVQRALEALALKRENQKLKQSSAPAILHLIGESPVLKNFESTLNRVAKMNSRVILTGEAGTGKTAAARYIHDNSSRNDKPFTVLSCATLSPDRFEIEIFGAEKGQVGPYQIDGLLHESNGGTLLLDEVADMPPATQAKIIRVLQSNSFTRVGGVSPIDVDIRFIATTHKDLEQEISEGRFREDLFYRLNVVPIQVPSLREYIEDLARFTEFYGQKISKKAAIQYVPFAQETIQMMSQYHWPGNIRQLRNVIELILIMATNKTKITPDDLPPEINPKAGQGNSADNSAMSERLLQYPLKEARAHFEHVYLTKQIERFGGNVSKTAEFVGMQRSALHRKIKQLQLSPLAGTLTPNERSNESA